ncbi:MAG: TatD family hydrolase [Patescibacteria group bacterium]
MIFDSHTHIHFPAYNKDREDVIKRAQKAGVKMITVGTNLKTSQEAIEIAEKYPDDIWATVGIHPNEIVPVVIPSGAKRNRGISSTSITPSIEISRQARDDGGVFDIQLLREMASHPKVVAIGECGLDYFRLQISDFKLKKLQKEAFTQQIKLAEELKKPLMIHCRPSQDSNDAYEDLIVILNEMKNLKDPSATPQDDGGVVVHFYAGSLDMAKKLLELGCYFTFGGVITFSRDFDEVIKFLPLENIMIETDAPYVAPEPHRGTRNEPAYVVDVAKKLAEIKNISYEEVIRQTTKNTKKVFDI